MITFCLFRLTPKSITPSLIQSHVTSKDRSEIWFNSLSASTYLIKETQRFTFPPCRISGAQPVFAAQPILCLMCSIDSITSCGDKCISTQDANLGYYARLLAKSSCGIRISVYQSESFNTSGFNCSFHGARRIFSVQGENNLVAYILSSHCWTMFSFTLIARTNTSGILIS